MTEKDLLIQDLRAENKRLKAELTKQAAKVTDLENQLLLLQIHADNLYQMIGGQNAIT